MVTDWEQPEKRKELGRILQNLREDAKITQLELSKLAGCSKNYISALERGVNKLTVPMLLEYCKALNITPNDVLGYSSNIDPELLDFISALEKIQQKTSIEAASGY